MSQKKIAVQEALQFGWNTLRENVAFFLKLFALLFVLAVIPAYLAARISQGLGPVLGLPLQFLNLAWQAILGMGMLKICLKLHDREPVKISDLWSCAPRTLDYIFAKILLMLIVGIGLLLLIIPGIVWALQFYFASFLVIDKTLGPVAALKGSAAVTRGAKWDLAIYAAIVLTINIIGALFFGIGLFLTIPITMLATVFVYRQLLSQTEETIS